MNLLIISALSWTIRYSDPFGGRARYVFMPNHCVSHSLPVLLASKRDRRKKHVEAPTEPQTALVEAPVPVAPTDDTPAKTGKERKSKARSRQSEQLTGEPAEDAAEVGMLSSTIFRLWLIYYTHEEPSRGSQAEVQVEADGEARGMGVSKKLIIGIDTMDAKKKKQRRRKTLSTALPDAEGTAHLADRAPG